MANWSEALGEGGQDSRLSVFPHTHSGAPAQPVPPEISQSVLGNFEFLVWFTSHLLEGEGLKSGTAASHQGE